MFSFFLCFWIEVCGPAKIVAMLPNSGLHCSLWRNKSIYSSSCIKGKIFHYFQTECFAPKCHLCLPRLIKLEVFTGWDQHYHSKCISLFSHRLQYMSLTNAGLCQGNMTWCFDVWGPKYHWMIDRYERLNLPVLSAVVEALEKAVGKRAIETNKNFIFT